MSRRARERMDAERVSGSLERLGSDEEAYTGSVGIQSRPTVRGHAAAGRPGGDGAQSAGYESSYGQPNASREGETPARRTRPTVSQLGLDPPRTRRPGFRPGRRRTLRGWATTSGGRCVPRSARTPWSWTPASSPRTRSTGRAGSGGGRSRWFGRGPRRRSGGPPACAAAGVGVVPQGGNTGLVAGAVPHAVVLSTARLASIGRWTRSSAP